MGLFKSGDRQKPCHILKKSSHILDKSRQVRPDSATTGPHTGVLPGLLAAWSYAAKEVGNCTYNLFANMHTA